MRFHKAAPLAGLALALTLSACGGGSSASAGSSSGHTTPVKFVLNYTPGPQHEEFVVAKESGYYSKAGLDVTMTPPSATTDPVKLVASGQADIGIAYAGDVISAAAQ